MQGTAEARTKGQVLMKYQKGDYFGELALLNNEPRAATVLASSNCKVASIDGESFKVGFALPMIHSHAMHYSST